MRWFERLVDPYSVAAPLAVAEPSVRGLVLAMLWPLRWVLGASLAFTVAAASIEVWLIGFAGRVVDLLAGTAPERLWAEAGGALVFAAVVVLGVRPVVHWLREATNDLGLKPNATAMVRWWAHGHVARQSVGWFQDRRAGQVATRVVESGSEAAAVIYAAVNATAYVGVYLIGVLGVLAAADPRLALPLLLWIGAYGVIMWRVIPVMERASEAFQDARSALLGEIVDAFSNIDTVRLFAGPSGSAGQPVFEAVRQAFFRLQRMEVRLNVALTLLEGVILVGLVGYGIVLWQSGAASLGMIAAALALSLKITSMMEWFLDAVWAIFSETGALRESLKSIGQPITVPDRPGAQPFDFQGGAIRAERLTHHYGRGRGGLDGLSLDIGAGEKVGLVGRSGVGKSTFVNLLLRFHDIEGGRILVDGQDICRVTQESLRARIGMVSQQAALLHRSVRENIALGQEGASIAAVEAAARQAAAHGFIEGLVDGDGRRGYEAHVGERGVKLSGGQRQRIALARVILKDAPILILDEATSALDSEVEAAIQETLADLMEGKTVIAIAHRLSTIAAMDRILVMDGGRVVETGPHEVLLAEGGLYAQLWQRQSGGFLGREAAA